MWDYCDGEQLTGTAKWQDITQLYEFDKHLVYHLLPKVTDRHVKLDVQSQMNVNLAAQVMSRGVAATLNTLATAGK
jgi:hypothetical protein